MSIWDSVRERKLVADGRNGPTTAPVDSSSLDPEAGQWEIMADVGEPDPMPVIAWDPARESVWVYGSGYSCN